MTNFFACICTRSLQINTITQDLLSFLSSAKVKIKLLADQKSIFKAYQRGVEVIKPEDEDIIIFCHDDIEIRMDPDDFTKKIEESLSGSDTGFVGPAGTTYLGKDAVWWNWDNHAIGKHRGKAYHVNESGGIYPTEYGPEGQVVVLDGVFLAAKAGFIKKLGLEKPESFLGEWDFYDIHYTTKAHLNGWKNYAIDFPLIHHSSGSLVGRDSWHLNKDAYTRQTKLPLSL